MKRLDDLEMRVQDLENRLGAAEIGNVYYSTYRTFPLRKVVLAIVKHLGIEIVEGEEVTVRVTP